MSIFIDSFLENGSTSCRFVLLFPRSVPKLCDLPNQDPWKWWTKNLQKFIDLEGQCQNVHLGQAHQIPLNHYIKKNWLFQQKSIYLGLSPFPVIVTSRIITFLVRDSEVNLHLPKGPHPTYITLLSISFRLSWHKFHQNSPPPAGTLHAHHHPQRHAGPEKKRETNSVFFIGLAFFWVFVSKKYQIGETKMIGPTIGQNFRQNKGFLAFWCPEQQNLSTSQGNFLWSFLLFLLKPKLKFVQPKNTCMRRQYIYFDWPMNSYVYIWIYICIYKSIYT